MAEGDKINKLNLENDASDAIKRQNDDLEEAARENLARIEALKTKTYTLQGLLDLEIEELGQIEILIKLKDEKLLKMKNELIEKDLKELTKEKERIEARIKRIEEEIKQNKEIIRAFGGVERAKLGLEMGAEIVEKLGRGGERVCLKELFEPFVKEFLDGAQIIWGDESTNEVESGSQEVNEDVQGSN